MASKGLSPELAAKQSSLQSEFCGTAIIRHLFILNTMPRVVGKFSIRLVPNLTPAETSAHVQKYLTSEFEKLNSKNTIKIEMGHGGKPWLSDPKHWNYQAAARATQTVYGVKPDLTREGGSIPVTLTIQDALQKSVVLLPMGRGNDMAHSTCVAPEI